MGRVIFAESNAEEGRRKLSNWAKESILPAARTFLYEAANRIIQGKSEKEKEKGSRSRVDEGPSWTKKWKHLNSEADNDSEV